MRATAHDQRNADNSNVAGHADDESTENAMGRRGYANAPLNRYVNQLRHEEAAQDEAFNANRARLMGANNDGDAEASGSDTDDEEGYDERGGNSMIDDAAGEDM